MVSNSRWVADSSTEAWAEGTSAILGWVQLWLPTSWPSRTSRATRLGNFDMFLPMTKKVAGAFLSFRMSRIFGVQRRSGPSSKVNATQPGWKP